MPAASSSVKQHARKTRQTCNVALHASQAQRERRPSAIVFDPSTLTLEEVAMTDGRLLPSPVPIAEIYRLTLPLETETANLVKTSVPGKSSRVKIYLNVGPEEHQVRTFFATVDLRKLGWGVRWQRRCGNISSIYVKGKPGAERVTGCL